MSAPSDRDTPEKTSGAKDLRSRITTDGIDRTPHRAFMRAMGLDDAAIAKVLHSFERKFEQTLEMAGVLINER